ncbi:Tox-REase-5 domain-containing protein [Treponema pedis]|uniref:Tox-REase-5 domain-containing protein n=1 Tax=Treponema pedis TaxID=409322 RepID=A0A7S7AV95_9SPIR|nr:Tox-REase-5 domain-containing protein [Treponema pedis]QOW59960.1 hypothetical protein IFE08_08815 [Treponema pedis]
MNSIPTPINPLSAGDKLFKAGLAKLRMSREVPKLREESENRKGIPCAGKSPLTARDLMDMIKARREDERNRKPSFKTGESDGGSGTWQKRTTPKKGADYQRQVTGAPENTEYVVKTDRMKRKEKKFDGYEPRTNTLIDAKDWKKWPPKGDSDWADRRRKQMLKNAKRDLDIAKSTKPPSKLKWIISDENNKQYLEKLFEDNNINIELEYIKKL